MKLKMTMIVIVAGCDYVYDCDCDYVYGGDYTLGVL